MHLSIGVKRLTSTFCGHFCSWTVPPITPLWSFKCPCYLLPLSTLSYGLGFMFNPFLCIGIPGRGVVRLTQHRLLGPVPRISNSVGQVRPKNLLFKQVPRWGWWPRNHIPRYAVLVPSLFSSSNRELSFQKKLLCLPQLFLISSCWIVPINQTVIKHRILMGLDPGSICINFKKTKQWYK